MNSKVMVLTTRSFLFNMAYAKHVLLTFVIIVLLSICDCCVGAASLNSKQSDQSDNPDANQVYLSDEEVNSYSETRPVVKPACNRTSGCDLMSNASTNLGEEREFVDERPKELPLALIIASPVVAVGIVIFVCCAYYWHSAQLDARARELALMIKSDDFSTVMIAPPNKTYNGDIDMESEFEKKSLPSIRTPSNDSSTFPNVKDTLENVQC